MTTEPTTTDRAARRGARRGIAAVAVLAGLVLAGCSVEVNTGGDVNTGNVENAIAEQYRAQGDVEVTVDCPGGVEPEQGATFTCEVTGPTGATADIEVRQDDDEGNVSWNNVPVGLNTGALEAQIAAEFQRQRSISVSVDCPSAVAAEEGNVFSCTVTAPNGDEAEAQVTQQDDEGNVRWRIV